MEIIETSLPGVLLIKPRVFGKQLEDLFQKKPRIHDVEFPSTIFDAEVFDITIPDGMQVDELPPPLDIDAGLLSYHSDVTSNAQILRYKRRYQLKQSHIPAGELEALEAIFRQIAASDGASVVLKRKSP